MSKWIVLGFACASAYACGGSADVAVSEPVAPTTLPTVAPPTPPPPPATPVARRPRRGDVIVTVSFTEMRKHPAAANVDAMIRSAAAWQAFPSIDPVRDLEWMTEHGNDLVVDHAVPDAQVDAAIAAVAQPVQVGVVGVKAWRGVVNHVDTVFLRAQPHVVRITEASGAPAVARDLVAHPPAAPPFHPHEAVRMRMLQPSATIAWAPDDISEARVWIDARDANGGADIYADADCPDAAAARVDAATLATLIRSKNSFPVRLLTGGILNNVEVSVVGSQVHVHVAASQQQLESVMTLASSMVATR